MIGEWVGMVTPIVLRIREQPSGFPMWNQKVFLGAWKQDLLATLRNVSSQKAEQFEALQNCLWGTTLTSLHSDPEAGQQLGVG